MDIFLDLHLWNSLLMIAMPAALGIFFVRRFGFGARLWWIGAAGFVLSQVGHIPFNILATSLFQNGVLPAPSPEWRLPFNAVFLGLSAGVWEELIRAGVFRYWARDARSWRKGVLLGAGHGGIEAVILGGLALLAFFNMVVMRGADLSKIVPADQLALAQQQVAAYWGAPWHMILLGSVERALTIPCHIAFSVLVLQAFTRRQPFWVALAVLYHALLDACVVYLAGIWAGESWGIYAVEGVLAIFTLISIGLIFWLRRPEPPAVDETPAPAAPVSGIAPESVEVEVKKEDLDRSRYI
jgi:uncharacterized membrane protein YhfC